MLCIC